MYERYVVVDTLADVLVSITHHYSILILCSRSQGEP